MSVLVRSLEAERGGDMATAIQVVIDCADPGALADFWATALHYRVQEPPEGFATWEDALVAWGVPESAWNDRSAVVDPDGAGPRVFFQRVPEPKQVKNRVHLDLNVGGGLEADPQEKRARIAAEAERLVAAGAARQAEFDEGREYWLVMQDPEGNEFCIQ
jgi:hypothetical protein